MSTTVVNVRLSRPFDVYIGRRSFAAVNGQRQLLTDEGWGNPFSIGRDGSRDEVIEKYRQYLLGNSALMARLPELRGKALGCWCKPAACHGDVLVELVASLPISTDAKGEK